MSSRRVARGPAVLVGIALAALLWGCSGRRAGASRPLTLLCAAGLQPAVEELLPAFAEQSGITIAPDYAGSGLILARANADAATELFLPGDSFYVDALAQVPGRVVDRVDIAFLVPCIITAKGNPKQIASLQDFARLDVQVAMGRPDTCQVGRVTVTLLEKAGVDLAGLDAKQSLTVNELALWVKLRDVDAAVVWDATAAMLGPTVEVVPIAVDPSCVSRVTLALLSGTRDAGAAREFLRFCSEPRGQGILRRKGFRIEPPVGVPPLGPSQGSRA